MARLRSDAAANREQLMLAALAMIEDRGADVPIDDLVRAAGVGVATFYRNFASREELLHALERRSYGVILDILTTSLAHEGSGIEALSGYFERCVARRAELYLPLRGSTVAVDDASTDERSRIVHAVQALVDRGREDGTIRIDIGPVDVIVFATMLTRPLPHLTDWDTIAQRQIEMMIAGLSRIEGEALDGGSPEYGDVEVAYRDSTERPQQPSRSGPSPASRDLG